MAEHPSRNGSDRQRQQEAAAAVAGRQQPYSGSPPADYSGASQPASSAALAAEFYGQSGGGTLVNKFGQHEPDNCYYTGATAGRFVILSLIAVAPEILSSAGQCR